MIKLNILILLITFKICSCVKEKISYMECQRPAIGYYDPNSVQNATATSRRQSRTNPLYFVSIRGRFLIFVDNSFTMHFYVYELLSNVYKRSFVEIHMNYCDFMNKDNIFLRVVKSTNFTALSQCPLPPAEYRMDNMTPPFGHYLKGFPFRQGRIYLNITNSKQKVIVSASIDMQIKEMVADKFYSYIQ